MRQRSTEKEHPFSETPKTGDLVVIDDTVLWEYRHDRSLDSMIVVQNRTRHTRKTGLLGVVAGGNDRVSVVFIDMLVVVLNEDVRIIDVR